MLRFLKSKKNYKIKKYKDRVIRLTGFADDKKALITGHREIYDITPELVTKHINFKNKIKRDNLNTNDPGCGCVVCKLNNYIRSYMAEKKRLLNIKKNIESYEVVRRDSEDAVRFRLLKKLANPPELLSCFSESFLNNMPIYLPPKKIKKYNSTEKIWEEHDVKIYYLRSNNCTSMGAQYNLIIKNINNLNIKIKKALILRESLKKLTYLP